MTFKSPSPQLILTCELATAAWSLYTLLYLSTTHGSAVAVTDYLLRTAAALLIANAVWKRKAWASIGVVVFAAYIGIPTLIRVFGQTLAMWRVGLLPSGDLWRDAGDLVQKIAQFVALVGGIHELRGRGSAA